MSFRTRLTWFFVAVVVIPMIAVALILFTVVSDSEKGKSDARLSQAQRTASNFFQALQRRAQDVDNRIARDREFTDALARDDRAALRTRLTALNAELKAVRTVLALNGAEPLAIGGPAAVAPATTQLVDASGKEVGSLTSSVVTPRSFVTETQHLTSLEVVVTAGGRIVGSTIATDEELPLRGSVTVNGRDFRVTGFVGPDFGTQRSTVRLLADQRTAASHIGRSTVLLGIGLLLVLGIALGFAFIVSRSLHEQVQKLLHAARRLGGGDFGVVVPTEGNDEFAELGSEFNSMARQLESRLDELQRERSRLQDAIRRVGESFARGLDRDALLEIVVQTAVDGVGADAGRATVRDRVDGRLLQVAAHGDLKRFSKTIQAVEAAVLDAGESAETNLGGQIAIAQPLLAEAGGRVLGLITVTREGRGFSDADRELFSYLASQAAVSIQNVDLHHTVRRQAVTDELTGLFNHRHFQEVISQEVERAKRFESPIGLIMLDLDNFKDVNDTYGHMQGDLVLREVAQVLRDSSREIDEPARYGGEEMAVVLPQTDMEGAFNFAERVRERIEALDVPLLDGAGTLRVTASIGAASASGSNGIDKEGLVAAADAALYRAKRSGKNRTVRAE